MSVLQFATPKSKYEAFIDDANDFVDRKPGALDLPTLESRAQALAAYSYVESRIALGIISSLKGDFDGVVANFKAAISASGGSPDVLTHYADSLVNVKHPDIALDIYKELHSAYPDDLSIISDAVRASLQSYNLPLVDFYLHKYDLLNPDGSETITRYKNWLNALKTILGDKYSEWKLFSNTISSVCDHLHTHGYMVWDIEEYYVDSYINMNITIDGDLEDVIEAENEVTNFLASQPASIFDDYFIMSCSQYERITD